MKTIHVRLTHVSIKKFKDNKPAKQLKDDKSPIYFRYSKVNNNVGTFFFVLYKFGKENWIKLGRYPALSPIEAHRKMLNLQREAEQKDIIPQQEKFIIMAQLLRWYLERLSKNKSLSQHTKQNQIACIKQHLLPLLGEVELANLSLPLIDEKLFQPLQAKLALSTVDNVLSVLNAAMNRAQQVQLIKQNIIPKCTLAEFTNQRPKIKATRITHKLLLSAIRGLSKHKVEHQLLFAMLIMHGTRIGETVDAKWEAFDFKEQLWRIPADDTKTKQAHILPLTTQTCTWLKLYKKYQARKGKSAYLFHQKKNKRKVISANQGSSIISTLANKQWSAHDLRKFARSYWMELGIDYMVGEFLLNHTLNKLNQTYIQTLAMPNCRTALQDWCNWLEQQGLIPSYKLDLKK
ncbi:MAG: tyrosine-type recombinase/integrase [Colwellia sp.]|nr:tyrosine-type recombinase/integrase [Colwellia sp.]